MSAYRACVEDITECAPDLRILFLRPEKKLAFKAGQYINIVQEGFEQRSYSIANAFYKQSNIIELHIRRGEHLSAYLCDDITVGSPLTFQGPFGTCTYKAQCKKPILALAGGAGLAQIKSIIEQALQSKRDNPIYLYHGARHTHKLYQNEYFSALSQQDPRLIYRPVVSDVPEELSEPHPIRYGFLMDHVARDFVCLKNYRAYMCGPSEMVAALETRLLDKNIDPQRIHADQWSGPS